ncbi:uncharacterized protein LOC103492970 isoform X2 [Cucumis melo]|uniref:Uncharacterized protein LOC103492970 isoform X2 n=1 Tax=Cucumis melo TaxID=3656 RepID=A0A1S4E3D1_CUCME|nr:uncharacterized protein LOC103492970 isoform X2 [Cucumis melo]XP_050941361.1 uncharacterized protein LOC103492970 isoform X2 [Cucumis melo]XP_050941362.1 uncharacterized protein LOC103492970 isoform X2 [Cucumis melo]
MWASEIYKWISIHARKSCTLEMAAASASLILPINGGNLPPSQYLSFRHSHPSATFSRLGWSRDQDVGRSTHRTRGQAFRISNVIMVDPLEAKRMAAKEMEKIKAKEKFKRRRQIEAINGAWAMIGLTAGLVIEGQTGKGILAQLADYFSILINFFIR